MKCDGGLEKVFTHDGRKYVVEFDFYYDKNEYEADIVRVEIFESNVSLTPGAFAAACSVVDAECAVRWQEYLADAADYTHSMLEDK